MLELFGNFFWNTSRILLTSKFCHKILINFVSGTDGIELVQEFQLEFGILVGISLTKTANFSYLN